MADKSLAVAEPIEAEVVKPTMGPRAISISSKQLRSQMTRDEEIRAVIDEYIKNNMVSGKDYGSITVKGKESKPSLLKPGAEKFCGLFKIRPTFKKDTDTVEMLGNTPGIIAYICELVDGRGEVIGEGRGSVKVDINGGDFDINKGVKIAEKRAQIDAVLRTGALSDFFTQDMEDAPRDTPTYTTKPASAKQIKVIYDTVARLIGADNKVDMDDWLTKAVGGTPDQLTTKSAGAVISKLFDAEKQKNAEPTKQLDTVYTDIPDEINLDKVPY